MYTSKNHRNASSSICIGKHAVTYTLITTWIRQKWRMSNAYMGSNQRNETRQNSSKSIPKCWLPLYWPTI